MDRSLREPKSEALISFGFLGGKWNNYEALFISSHDPRSRPRDHPRGNAARRRRPPVGRSHGLCRTDARAGSARRQRRTGALRPGDLRPRHPRHSGLPDPLRSPRAAARRRSSQGSPLQRPHLPGPYWDEIFTEDRERKQTRAEAEATCAVMRETYAALGYEITELPYSHTPRRANFVGACLRS